MKKLLVVITALLFFSKENIAQNNKLTSAVLYYQGYQKSKDPEDLKNAKLAIDTASKHPDTQNKAKTWYYKGEIYNALFAAAFTKLKDSSKETEDKKKGDEAFRNVDTKDLETSIAAYQKAMQLDVKKDFPESKKKMEDRVNLYSGKSIALYNNKKFEEASVCFEKQNELSITYTNVIDSAALKYAAYSAAKAKNYDRAAMLYNKVLEIKYKSEETYTELLEIYNIKPDLENYKATLVKARAAFPNNFDFIIDEINISLKEGKSEQAITNLKTAIEKDPKNIQLHLVLGQTYTKMAFPKDKDGKDAPKPSNFTDLIKSAQEAFDKAYALNPNDFKVNYSIGAYYNNLGAGKMKEAQEEKDMKKAQDLENQSVEILKKAIPYLEKAHELDKSDKDTMKALKQLYAKTGQADSPKYKELEDLLKN